MAYYWYILINILRILDVLTHLILKANLWDKILLCSPKLLRSYMAFTSRIFRSHWVFRYPLPFRNSSFQKHLFSMSYQTFFTTATRWWGWQLWRWVFWFVVQTLSMGLLEFPVWSMSCPFFSLGLFFWNTKCLLGYFTCCFICINHQLLGLITGK